MNDSARLFILKGGAQLTPELEKHLVREAEAGYDLSQALRVDLRPGRPARGEPSGESPRVHVRVPENIYTLAKERAAAEGSTLSRVLRQLLADYAASDRGSPTRGGNGTPSTVRLANRSTDSLFSAGERTRLTPRRHGEPSYPILDQAAAPLWKRVRACLHDWYAEWPADNGDLARRFRDDDQAQHYGAFWELYLHQSLRSAGFLVRRNPPMPGTSKTPDFLITKDGRSIAVEATMAFPGSEEERKRVILEGAIYDEFNKTQCEHWLEVDFLQSGSASPPVRKMREQLEIAVQDAGGREVLWHWRRDDWWIQVRAVPRTLPARREGQNPVRPCGLFPPSDASLDERPAPIAAALDKKRKRYGRPGPPYVIAVLPELSVYSSFGAFRTCAEIADPIRAFFAANGNEHVSAVVTAPLLKPWTVAKRFPVVWHNPRALRPLAIAELPWPAATSDLGADAAEAGTAAAFFGLPPDWPGPGEPFPLD